MATESALSSGGAGLDRANVRLELGSGTNLEELQSTVEANASLRKVELFFSHSFSQKTRQETTRFIESISRLPALNHLILASEQGDLSHYALPISMLSTVFDLATGLEKIELGLIELVGRLEDFASLEQSLQNHSSLTEIISACWLSEETRMSLSLDPFIRAIAASRALQSIILQPAFTFGGLANVTAGILCTLPTLQKLTIAKCNLVDENVVAMAEVLRENTFLRELRMSCRIEEPASLAIANCLRVNTKLEVLVIHNTSTIIDSDSTDSTVDIHNTNVETTTNDAYYAQIAQALQTNETLRHFALHGTKLSQASTMSFVQMIRGNYWLENISLVDLSGDFKEEMEMFTFLNRCGRAALFEVGGNGREQWIETMALVVDEINCLFYLLSTKPSLCALLDTDQEVQKRRQASPTGPHPSSKRSKTT